MVCRYSGLVTMYSSFVVFSISSANRSRAVFVPVGWYLSGKQVSMTAAVPRWSQRNILCFTPRNTRSSSHVYGWQNFTANRTLPPSKNIQPDSSSFICFIASIGTTPVTYGWGSSDSILYMASNVPLCCSTCSRQVAPKRLSADLP